jgi:hypothetical protein
MSDIPDSGSFNLGLANINSQNYGPTATANQANANANTANQQQAAQAQAMQNKIMQARMPLILAGIHKDAVDYGAAADEDDQSGVQGAPTGISKAGAGPRTPGEEIASEDKSAVAPSQNFYQPEMISAALRSKYTVQNITPQESAALNRAFQVDPTDQYGMGPKRVQAQIDMRKTQQTQQVQISSRNDFDKLSAVTDAPEGNAMSVLQSSHPETVAAIRRQFAKDPNAEVDEDAAARMFAAHTAGVVHQYTGRKAVVGKDGVYRDEETGITIPGVEQVGLSKEEYIKLAHEALTPSVELDDGNGGKIKVAPWRAAQIGGATNIHGPGDWIMVSASQRGLPGASATLSPNSAPKQEAQRVAQSALDTAQKQRDNAPNPASGVPKPVNGVGTARNVQGNIDPKLTDALHDDKYNYTPTNNGEPYKAAIGHTPPPAVQEDMKNQTSARNSLAKDSGQGIGAASAALTMYKAAQDVLAKGNYNGGAWNAELAKYSKWLPAGWQGHMTGDYQEIAKYLGTAALQSGKGIFAKMTQMEAQMLTKELNPSAGMDPTAMRDMIAKGAKVAQYSIDSAKRVPAYLHAGKDANQFNTWNQDHFPMETETQPTAAKPNAGVTAPTYNDAQVRAYMQKHGLTDEKATRKALGMN